MTEIIYGFIMAIWVVLNLIYFRLGSIRDELGELNRKQHDDARRQDDTSPDHS